MLVMRSGSRSALLSSWEAPARKRIDLTHVIGCLLRRHGSMTGSLLWGGSLDFYHDVGCRYQAVSERIFLRPKEIGFRFPTDTYPSLLGMGGDVRMNH